MSREQQYRNLMAEMKRQVKSLSHNDLARSYVNLYAQYVLLDKELQELKEKVGNTATITGEEAKSEDNNAKT